MRRVGMAVLLRTDGIRRQAAGDRRRVNGERPRVTGDE
ncbi:predicted protein [Streptomyces filamentosus NRRL 15998]|uniref:Predicted protein n=1 Tax=Streptomyces filamentosus NRRL 15998 TaxID=457431 RepID=D6ALZ4_STRFL|nr:predicted protein [Streptomyces filamentosus NRRL 15998]